MEASRPVRVFISYARRDGGELAERLCGDLASRGFEPWMDRQRLNGGASWTREIDAALDAANVVLAVLSRGSCESEMCQDEQVYALRNGKCVIPLLAEEGVRVPFYLVTKQFLNFAYSYPAQFERLVADIQSQQGAVLKAAYRTTYVTAPPLPANFVERPEALESLRKIVITDGGNRHIAVTALAGMGGIGKTVLAQALCADEAIQAAFPDGVIWLTIGRESTEDLVTRMREVGKGLGDDPARYDTPLGATSRYRTTLREKAALIVLDDVWDARDVEPFRADSLRSRLLFTTRDGSIAAAVGAREFTADLLTEEQSRECLAKWSGRDTHDLPVESGELIRECGRLPLALSMIGAMLRGKPAGYWKGVLDLLRRADLERIGKKFPHYPHPNLFRAIEVSVAGLDEKTRERYVALAVLLEDTAAELPVLRTLWKADEFEALETAAELIGRSLATRSGDKGGITLHDLQFDFVRAQSPLREALPLIHGAVRLSAHVISRDPRQFASQMRGRLLGRDEALIQKFVAGATEGAPRPWLCPLHSATLSQPGGALIRTLEGHAADVNGVALSADGKRAVSASDDGTLKVWDVESGRELRTLEGNSAPIRGVALSARRDYAVSASNDGTLKVWDVDSGREVRTLRGHTSVVMAVALNADGKLAISASNDETLKVWDVESGCERGTLRGHTLTVAAVALSADGKCAVSGSYDNTVRLWDLESRCEIRALHGHSHWVRGVALSTDGKRAISSSDDKTIKVWDLESGREIRTLRGHASFVTGIALSADGKRAVSASSDETLRVWDVGTGRETHTLQGHTLDVLSVALSLDGKRAVSASRDGTLKVWDLESGRETRALPGHAGWVKAVALSADGSRSISASGDGKLKIWDLESGRQLRALEDHSSIICAVTLSASGDRAVSGFWDGTVKVWDVESGREICVLRNHADIVVKVALSTDGKLVISASADCTLKVSDLESGRGVRTLEGHFGWLRSVALSADGKRAVSVSDGKILNVWDVYSGRQVRALQGDPGLVSGLALSADAKRAISASGDGTLRVWDLESGREFKIPTGHTVPISEVALSGDGRRAVCQAHDKTLKVWDVESGDEIATFTADVSMSACVIAGSDMIVAGDSFGNVHFLKLIES